MHWTGKIMVDLDALASPTERYQRTILEVLNAEALDFFPSRKQAIVDMLCRWSFTPAIALTSSLVLRLKTGSRSNTSLLSYSTNLFFGGDWKIEKIWISKRLAISIAIGLGGYVLYRLFKPRKFKRLRCTNPINYLRFKEILETKPKNPAHLLYY